MSAASPFRIKICGVKRSEDLVAASESGADAVGLNFFPPSVRYMDPLGEQARSLAAEAEQLGLNVVGLFVNSDVDSIAALTERVRLTFVQLHGDETPAAASRLRDAGVAVLRAVRLPRRALSPAEIEDRVAPWREVGAAILLDADAGSSYGGEGVSLDWRSIGAWSEQAADHWILAGGLGPKDVFRAIQIAKPHGVDVASGVEAPRGTKDANLVNAFCLEAERGLQEQFRP
ncbi:N-(5'-phosphoribosyl)anthranilate isomerase [Roseimaritima multifibrata]|uniref:N-(5'-phosphoribosyl)anthranilate isomerase n=1 Tax=Roseimaritima multifibrata TaxID=1930274 RepID=A0A517ME26_9BACT|nr:phosphoribosylanthranilate isomerase [Roseimaritima multifibrata]QDS93142.1 N-(5'-phosphoribosyl)anthranilate isomerase [Roseimaritima multifibrata]